MQQVSSAPCTRTDIIRLEELLDTKLQQGQARAAGICPIRRELYSQCFGKEEAEMLVITETKICTALKDMYYMKIWQDFYLYLPFF